MFSRLITRINPFAQRGDRFSIFSPNLFKRCPKTGKIRGINRSAWPKWALFFTGLAACVWYLFRVIPKPSRAAYPCQRATAPLRIGFLIYCAALAGYTLSFTKARSLLRNKKHFRAALCFVVAILLLAAFIANDAHPVWAANPVGVAKGIFPGRVAWVYNPDAANWTGTGNYWDAAVNPQGEYNKSFTAGIAALSGGTNDADSWDRIFRWFNDNRGRAGTGYQPGDRIAIKINQNNSPAPAADHGNGMNANPQTCVAVVASLVNAGVPQADIWIGDPSRAVTDNIFNAIHNAFPTVNVVDYFGNNGRVTSTVVNGVFPNNDVKNAEAACFYNARYIINQPLLKGHVGQVITFGSKNFYGINGILPDWTQNIGHPGDSALTAYMTNANFGGKVVLWCMDAMYPSPALDGAPFNGVALTPFSGKQMSSFIMSLDGVAEECVSYDFWSTISGQSGGINYLSNAANAGAGVADHWNNSTAKQYAKNLNPNANGIELVWVRPDQNNFGTSSVPTLTIGVSGTNAVISWPALPNWALETTSALGASDGWNPATTSPLVMNLQCVVTNTVGATAQFYRLEQKP